MSIEPRELSNRVLDSYDAIIDAACEACQKLLAVPQTMTSIGVHACPEALMMQERGILKPLARVDGYRMDETGVLVLTEGGRAAVTARR